MPVSLPTAADVRKAREQAARGAAERAEVARTPLLAVLGAGDYAVSTVVGAVTTARTAAANQAEDAAHRVAELPGKLTPSELRKTVDEFRAGMRNRAEGTYVGLAERGEKAWGRIRRQPRVQRALSSIENYTEKLDVRVDGFVDDAHDAAEKALGTVTRQTRSTGEKTARATQRFAGEAAETVADAGSDAAETITEAGDEAAAATRSTSRKAANRTAPMTAPKDAARKPATRRADGTKS